MSYTITPNLSEYGLSRTGEVLQLDTQELLEQEYSTSIGKLTYKLLTDEKLTLRTGTIRLWRRFTTEDIIKLASREGNTPVEGYEAVEELTVPYYRILGVNYKTSRDASKAINVAHTTIQRRVDKGEEGYEYITV